MMRIALAVIVSVALNVWMAAGAAAQVQPTIEQTAYRYDDGSAASSSTSAPAQGTINPATQPAKGDAQKDEKEEKDEEGKDSKPTCRWCQCGKLADPWKLPQPPCLADRNITVGGWVDAGVYGNQYGAPNNGPIGLRSIGDGFTVDQVWCYAERKTDTKGCGWDLGWRVDYLFGTDGPQTQSFGDHSFDFDWNTSSQYGFAMPQLYAEVAYNDLKVKLGHFYTPIGYEVVQAPQNFFYSHSYSHTFGEPFTHTGVLASYAKDEKATYYAGWVDGWDEGFAGRDGGSTFLGGVSWNLSKKANLAWYVSAGELGNGQAFPGAASGDLYYNCLIFTYKLSDRWTYVLEHDLGTNFNVNPESGVDNQWYEINNYLMYKVSDCLSYGGRFEWFQDPQGARVVAGDRGTYWALTAGLNWRPHANVTIRPEIRYDWFNGTPGPSGLPFNGGASSSQLSGGMDAIFTF